MDRDRKKGSFLAYKMKTLSILSALVLLSCVAANKTTTQVPSGDDIEQTYSTVSMNKFSLTLRNSDGKCVLSYIKVESSQNQPPSSIELSMDSPCEFVRKPGRQTEPLYYVYGSKYIVMIVGGPPDRTQKDQFQPQGCGTEIQAVRIIGERVEVSERIEHGFYSAVCPSEGLDEVFFATVPLK